MCDRGGTKPVGWDFVVFCDAAAAFLQGANPYFIANLAHSRLPFVYPPVTLPFFSLVCAPTAVVSPTVAYTLLYTLLLLGSALLVVRADHRHRSGPILLAALLITGFGGTYRAFETGNSAPLITFILALTYVAILRDRLAAAGVSLVAAAAFKLFPLCFGVSFLVGGHDRSEKLRAVGVTGLTAVIVLVANVLVFPTYVRTYYRSLAGQLSQHNPLQAGGGRVNPTSFYFLEAVNEFITGGVPAVRWALYLGFVVAVGALFVHYARNHDGFSKTFSVGVIAVLLVLPRLKNYSLLLAALPVYFLVRDASTRTKLVALTLAAIPVAAIPLQIILTENLWFYRLLIPVELVIGYIQLLSLAAFFVFVVFVSNTRSA